MRAVGGGRQAAEDTTRAADKKHTTARGEAPLTLNNQIIMGGTNTMKIKTTKTKTKTIEAKNGRVERRRGREEEGEGARIIDDYVVFHPPC